MKHFLLRQFAASPFIAIFLLTVNGCQKDWVAQEDPVVLLLPVPELNCGINSAELRCEGIITIPEGGATGLTLTLQCFVPNNYLDTLLAKNLWLDSIQSIYASACSVVSFGSEAIPYDCGSTDSPSTCYEIKPIPLPQIAQIKLRLIGPGNPSNKVVLGEWTPATSISPTLFPLNGADVKSAFYPLAPWNQFVLEIEIKQAAPVAKTCPAKVSIGFCMKKA